MKKLFSLLVLFMFFSTVGVFAQGAVDRQYDSMEQMYESLTPVEKTDLLSSTNREGKAMVAYFGLNDQEKKDIRQNAKDGYVEKYSMMRLINVTDVNIETGEKTSRQYTTDEFLANFWDVSYYEHFRERKTLVSLKKQAQKDGDYDAYNQHLDYLVKEGVFLTTEEVISANKNR